MKDEGKLSSLKIMLPAQHPPGLEVCDHSHQPDFLLFNERGVENCGLRTNLSSIYQENFPSRVWQSAGSDSSWEEGLCITDKGREGALVNLISVMDVRFKWEACGSLALEGTKIYSLSFEKRDSNIAFPYSLPSPEIKKDKSWIHMLSLLNFFSQTTFYWSREICDKSLNKSANSGTLIFFPFACTVDNW